MHPKIKEQKTGNLIDSKGIDMRTKIIWEKSDKR